MGGIIEDKKVAPIFKKGNREVEGNYRGVVMLDMGSRILARFLKTRLRWWAEHLQLLDDNQNSFRQGRSSADATQIMVRMLEDMTDIKKRKEQQSN